MSQWSYQTPQQFSDEEYARWQALLEKRTGISFVNHKSILQKGLVRRMREIGIDDYDEYFRSVSAVPEGVVEWVRLVDHISVKETSFFRDLDAYKVLRKYLKICLEEKIKSQSYSLDLWSVGCSTGEEPYSLAIQSAELIDDLSANFFLGVIATDISQSALSNAKRGVYQGRKLDNLSGALKNKYFLPVGDMGYQVLPELRQRVCFVQGNMLELDASPVMDMDVIFCQNVLIYFRRELRHQILNGLMKRLKPGGLLVVSPGEAVGWAHKEARRIEEETAQAYIKV